MKKRVAVYLPLQQYNTRTQKVFHKAYVPSGHYATKRYKYKKSDWKLPADEDPRITRIGKFLRATSIDETPQFINVLKGEMSIVGHRPYRPEEIEEYAKRYPQTKKYIEIIKTSKPGITGLWQISGRNELNFEQRSKLDANYILHRSLRQELLIILKTPFAMLSIW